MADREEATKDSDFTLNDDDDDDEDETATWEIEDAAWTNDLDEGEGEGDVKDESAAYLEFLQEEVGPSIIRKRQQLNPEPGPEVQRRYYGR